jgi:hypothetical protein
MHCNGPLILQRAIAVLREKVICRNKGKIHADGDAVLRH